jgi:hypothetical protein
MYALLSATENVFSVYRDLPALPTINEKNFHLDGCEKAHVTRENGAGKNMKN